MQIKSDGHIFPDAYLDIRTEGRDGRTERQLWTLPLIYLHTTLGILCKWPGYLSLLSLLERCCNNYARFSFYDYLAYAIVKCRTDDKTSELMSKWFALAQSEEFSCERSVVGCVSFSPCDICTQHGDMTALLGQCYRPCIFNLFNRICEITWKRLSYLTLYSICH